MFLCLSGLGGCCGFLIHCGHLLLCSGGLAWSSLASVVNYALVVLGSTCSTMVVSCYALEFSCSTWSTMVVSCYALEVSCPTWSSLASVVNYALVVLGSTCSTMVVSCYALEFSCPTWSTMVVVNYALVIYSSTLALCFTGFASVLCLHTNKAYQQYTAWPTILNLFRPCSSTRLYCFVESVWKPLLGVGLCHSWSLGSPPEVTKHIHTTWTLSWTPFPCSLITSSPVFNNMDTI